MVADDISGLDCLVATAERDKVRLVKTIRLGHPFGSLLDLLLLDWAHYSIMRPVGFGIARLAAAPSKKIKATVEAAMA